MGKYSHFIDLTGQTFGRLTVLSRLNKQGETPVKWDCLCSCGNKTIVISANLRNGTTNSCGCLRKETSGKNFRTHGKTKTRTYKIWAGMKVRCNNSNFIHFEHYGGRGITICERWGSYENFLADMGEAPEDKSLDRIDVNGNYEPLNCRWASKQEQAINRRKRKTFNEHSFQKFLDKQDYLTIEQKHLLIKNLLKEFK
jgi:hypothetical protein